MDTREKVANLLLERGVRFKLPAPFFLRLLGLHKLTIRPFKVGTLLEISRLVVKHKLDKALLETDSEFLLKTLRPISECMALAILNSKWKIKLFKKPLARYLLAVSTNELIEMFTVVLRLNRVSDFTNITKFFSLQAVSLLAPNLGQERNGR